MGWFALCGISCWCLALLSCQLLILVWSICCPCSSSSSILHCFATRSGTIDAEIFAGQSLALPPSALGCNGGPPIPCVGVVDTSTYSFIM